MFNTLLEATDDNFDYKNQWIIGKVVANDDSQEEDGQRLQRVKVFIPGLYDDTDTSLYPWAFPKQPTLFGNGVGFGSFGVPDLNSYLAIELQNGDPHFPVYVCQILLDGLQLSEAAVNYPNRYGFKDRTGNLYYVDKTTGDIVLQHKSGTVVHIENNGKTTIHAKDDLVLQSDTGIRLIGPTLTAAGITGDVDFSGIGGNFKTP